MATDHIVSLLITERDRLTRAIEALQGPGRRPGRPPKGTSAPAAAAPTLRKRGRKRGWTAAQKRAQAQRMRAYWAKRQTKLAKK